MKNILGLILLLTFYNVYGQENNLIGKYIKVSEDKYYNQGFDNYYLEIDTSSTKLKLSNRWYMGNNGRTSFDNTKGKTGKIVGHIKYRKKESLIIENLDSRLVYYKYNSTLKKEFSYVDTLNSLSSTLSNVSDEIDSFDNYFYKGFAVGMNKDQVREEFVNNKDKYKSIDLGNGFIYRIYTQNCVYDKDSLIGIRLSVKGSAMGLSYQTVVNCLNYTGSFFVSKNYDVFYKSKWWNAPQSYANNGMKWGYVLVDNSKSKVIQLYPGVTTVNKHKNYSVQFIIWDYKSWMKLWNKSHEINETKSKASGF
jgi:hypothetical protein